MDNIGNVTSIRTITDTLSSNKTKIDHKTVGKYMDALCKAFAFYRIRRYDIRGKRYLRSEDKYYLADQSFRFARLGTKNMDYGRVLEIIVSIELLRRGYYEGNSERSSGAGRRSGNMKLSVWGSNYSDEMPEYFVKAATPCMRALDSVLKVSYKSL